jgi:hypothetical protein
MKPSQRCPQREWNDPGESISSYLIVLQNNSWRGSQVAMDGDFVNAWHFRRASSGSADPVRIMRRRFCRGGLKQ